MFEKAMKGSRRYGQHGLNLAPPEDYWGSQEEYEIQLVLQEFVLNLLNPEYCDFLVKTLHQKMVDAGSTWIDRFVLNQGVVVLAKILEYTHGCAPRDAQRELNIIRCLCTAVTSCTLAKQLCKNPLPERCVKLLLQYVLEPMEEMRVHSAAIIVTLKTDFGCHYKALQSLNLGDSFEPRYSFQPRNSVLNR